MNANGLIGCDPISAASAILVNTWRPAGIVKSPRKKKPVDERLKIEDAIRANDLAEFDAAVTELKLIGGSIGSLRFPFRSGATKHTLNAMELVYLCMATTLAERVWIELLLGRQRDMVSEFIVNLKIEVNHVPDTDPLSDIDLECLKAIVQRQNLEQSIVFLEKVKRLKECRFKRELLPLALASKAMHEKNALEREAMPARASMRTSARL